MIRTLVLTASFVLTSAVSSAQQPAAPASPPAAATAPAAAPAAAQAKATFDAQLAAWNGLIKQINDLQKQRKDAQETARGPLDAQIQQARQKAEQTLASLTDAGLAAYRADATAYADVNSTLLFLAQYHLTGDGRGDGGDQYERALTLIKPLLEAGAGEKWPQLWAWAGVAAYCTNDFDAAESYFDHARKSGGLTSQGGDPRITELVGQAMQNLPTLKRSWEKEKELRDAESKKDDLPRVKFTTAKGDIVIELFENEAPQAVANFISLVKKGFYDGVVFHRVLSGFMAQGGDPTGTGSGGPGYSIKCECYKPEYRRHFRGTLSMAHAGRDTGGSQFFLTYVPTSFLDGKHTVFGRVVEGMDIAAAIKRRDPDAPVGSPDKIIKAEVLRDRGHAYEFEKLPGR